MRDAAGSVRSVSVPFSTTILEAPADDMMTGMDMNFDETVEPEVPEQSFWDKLKDPKQLADVGCCWRCMSGSGHYHCDRNQEKEGCGRIRGRR